MAANEPQRNDGVVPQQAEHFFGLISSVLPDRALLKRQKILSFDEATSNLDAETAEHFARTINRLKGQTTMLFIAYVLPKALLVDEVVRFGGAEGVGMGEKGGKGQRGNACLANPDS